MKRIEAATAENIFGWDELGPSPGGAGLDVFGFGDPSPGLNTRSARRGGSAFPSAIRSSGSLRSAIGSGSSGGKAKHLGEETDPGSISTGLTPGTGGGSGGFFGSEMTPGLMLTSPGVSGLLQTPNFQNIDSSLFGNFFSDGDDGSLRPTPRLQGASPRSTRSAAALSPSLFLKSPNVQAPTPSSRRGQAAQQPQSAKGGSSQPLSAKGGSSSMSGAKAAAAAAAARADDGKNRGSTSSPTRKRGAPPSPVLVDPPAPFVSNNKRPRPSPVNVGGVAAALPPSSGPASSRSRRSARR